MMERLKCFLRWFLDFVPLIWAVVLLGLIICFASCSTRYVPVESVRRDSIRVVDVHRDSIFVQDSVFIREKADTVFFTRWRTEYREALKVDTVLITRIDSVQNVVEIERDFTRLEKLRLSIGSLVLWAIPIILGLWLLYRKFLK